MSDSAEKLPAKVKTQAETLKDEGLFNPLDLVSKGGYVGNPREIMENPAVTPETLDRSEEMRDDLVAETEDETEGIY